MFYSQTSRFRVSICVTCRFQAVMSFRRSAIIKNYPQVCVIFALLGYLHTLLRIAIVLEFKFHYIGLIIAVCDFCLFQVPLIYGVWCRKSTLLQPFICETVCKLLFLVIFAPFRWVLWMSFNLKDPDFKSVDEFLAHKLPDGFFAVVGQLILLSIVVAVVLYAKEMITRAKKIKIARMNKSRQKLLHTPRHVTAIPLPNLMCEGLESPYPILKVERDYV
ncbi:hypothetical protein QR680_013893 [Steinernema hermaphroditum]|uniref:Uncharacterized protein n=1 Tax=Steinernema hermaphroditum TaxID=289476 RepID=A0AA39I715_9BILA|nr:hypothetical protein QR680_013893 [Steinernema hermaphroditum]